MKKTMQNVANAVVANKFIGISQVMAGKKVAGYAVTLDTRKAKKAGKAVLQALGVSKNQAKAIASLARKKNATKADGKAILQALGVSKSQAKRLATRLA